jgi:protein-tyrosine phosphatase
MTTKILFVCLGNICRSPTAEAVFTAKAISSGLNHLTIDSAGTGNWHQGHPPDERATAHAAKRGYDLTPLRARQVTTSDFEKFDFILAMDRQNERDLKRIAPNETAHKIKLFLQFGQSTETEVPDPYYGGAQGFEHVLDLIEDASEGLIEAIRTSH